jgi:hypothetical protein
MTLSFISIRMISERESRCGMKKAAALLILVALMLLAIAVVAEAQQVKKVHRIGYLSQNDPATESTRSEAIRLHLRKLDYIDGQNIAFEYRYAEGKRDRFPEIAAETEVKMFPSIRGSLGLLLVLRWTTAL